LSQQAAERAGELSVNQKRPAVTDIIYHNWASFATPQGSIQP